MKLAKLSFILGNTQLVSLLKDLPNNFVAPTVRQQTILKDLPIN